MARIKFFYTEVEGDESTIAQAVRTAASVILGHDTPAPAPATAPVPLAIPPATTAAVKVLPNIAANPQQPRKVRREKTGGRRGVKCLIWVEESGKELTKVEAAQLAGCHPTYLGTCMRAATSRGDRDFACEGKIFRIIA